MDSDEENFFLPPPESPSPVHHTKLKRLRRASRVSEETVVSTPAADPGPSVYSASEVQNTGESENASIPESEENAGASSPVSGLGMGVDDELDPLFGDRGQFTGCETADLDWEAGFDETEELQEGGDGSQGVVGKSDSSRKKKSAKKRLSLDGEEDATEKKKTKKKRVGEDGKAIESARKRKRLEKERKAYLEQLHAESQRLLRETRDASFKPLPLVQKPISSVLEKIRHRKLEMLKTFSVYDDYDSPADVSGSPSDIHGSGSPFSRQDETEPTESADMDKSSRAAFVVCPGVPEIPIDSNESFQHDADSSLDSPARDLENKQPEKQADSSPENSDLDLPKTSLKPDFNLLEDNSSDEEDNDKENTDPLQDKSMHVNLFKTGLAKTFVDDEAEEEDDSDHDMLRFQENEEDDESEESEGPNDLIAIAYEEMPIDQERRNQLHQKWLEQQDAAETDNFLQRLKQKGKQREPTDFEDEEAVEEFDDDSDEDSLNDAVLENEVRQNSKKEKQMIAQMFSEGDDGFESSDDEETEQRLSRQRLLEQEDKPSLLSPAEDENSKEVFSLIKKLNIAPDPKRRTKAAASTYDMLIKGGNNNSSSKSSFLGRATSNSLPSSIKKGPSTVKSFIFGRDDSNSRSAISASENLSEMNKKENLPKKTATAKFSASQSKPSDSKKKPANETAHGSSLFEILRRSSMQFDQTKVANQRNGSMISETQAAYQLTSFKLRNKVSRKLTQEA